MRNLFKHNFTWAQSCKKSYNELLQNTENVSTVQNKILFKILKNNQETYYGKKYTFNKIKSISEFQANVPITTYEDIKSEINHIWEGKKNILSVDETLCFEITSGSSGNCKIIPYTKKFLREYQKGIEAWMYDLYIQYPKLMYLKQFWSISPDLRKNNYSPGGHPIGFENDIAYITEKMQPVVKEIIFSSRRLTNNLSFAKYKRTLLIELLKCKELGLLSVWSPTYLLELFDEYEGNFDYKKYWPNLQVISCWGNSSSTSFLNKIKALFPEIPIQEKGLMATEGIFSLPFMGNKLPLAAFCSHFLEFKNEAGQIHLLDEIELNQNYEIIMSSSNGLTRYSMGDMVVFKEPLRFQFLGRSNCTSDICGEKLNESFVSKCLSKIFLSSNYPGYTYLVPCTGKQNYYLVVSDNPEIKKYIKRLETELCTNPHYEYCRKLNQLKSLKVLYDKNCIKRCREQYILSGLSWGDIKDRCLIKHQPVIELYQEKTA